MRRDVYSQAMGGQTEWGQELSAEGVDVEGVRKGTVDVKGFLARTALVKQ